MSIHRSQVESQSLLHLDVPLGRRRIMDKPVVIYDSGVGGLSVAKQFLRACPHEDVIYIADNAWFPYGNKMEDRLKTRVAYIIESITDIVSPIGILVACNTASTAATEYFGKRDIPIVGVLPPIAKAVQAVGEGKIALLSTPGTAFRSVVHERIFSHAKEGQVVLIGALGLVYLAEEKMANGYLSEAKVKQVLDPLICPKMRSIVQAVILGCTHFPLIQEELSWVFPNVKHWIDPAKTAVQTLINKLPRNVDASSRPTSSGAHRRVILTSDHNRIALEQVFVRQGFTPLNLRLPVFLRRSPAWISNGSQVAVAPQNSHAMLESVSGS